MPLLCLLSGPEDHKKLLDPPAKDVGPRQGLLGRGSIFDIRLAASFAVNSISLNSYRPLSRCKLWTLSINPILILPFSKDFLSFLFSSLHLLLFLTPFPVSLFMFRCGLCRYTVHNELGLVHVPSWWEPEPP